MLETETELTSEISVPRKLFRNETLHWCLRAFCVCWPTRTKPGGAERYKLRLRHAWSPWILYTPTLWPACTEPGAYDFHLPNFNTPTVSNAEYQQFALRKHDIHTVNQKHNIHMWYEQHYFLSKRAAGDWSWLAHEVTWQYMRRSVQNTAAIVRVANISTSDDGRSFLGQLACLLVQLSEQSMWLFVDFTSLGRYVMPATHWVRKKRDDTMKVNCACWVVPYSQNFYPSLLPPPMYELLPNVAVWWLTLLISVWDFPGSNLGLSTPYFDVSLFSSALPGK
jgi:hypothetical protein